MRPSPVTDSQITLTIHREANYSSIWLKGIQAVRLHRHCIDTFVGARYAIDVNANAQTLTIDLGDHEQALYLCGVSSPYRWANNAHLAIWPSPGARWHGDAHVSGLRVTMTGGHPIFGWGEHDVDPNHPMFSDRLYRTCRNLQFGWWAHAHLGTPVVGT
ncbi:MAG: hypothetical protein NVSMB48_05540 [Marmoricola sp.]